MSSREDTYDVIVVGAGPAGIAAACRAAESGRRVVVIDEGRGPGGQIWRPSLHALPPSDARRWLSRLDASGADVRHSTSVFDATRNADRTVVMAAESDGRSLELVSRAVVVATGARERFLPFPGWTLPNVVGVGGAQALLKAGMSVRGRRVVIAGSGPLLLPVAASLASGGAELLLVAEQAPGHAVRKFAMGLWRRPATLVRAAVLRAAFMSTRYSTGTWVTSATGDESVRGVTVTNGETTRTFPCDILCVAFGLVPNVELARLLGCDIVQGAVTVDATQATNVDGVFCAGEPTGIGGVDLSLVEGEIAGFAAAGGSVPQKLVARRAQLRRDAIELDQTFAPRAELRALARPDTIVCRCEDVRLRDLSSNWTARQAKLYVRAGMGPCQGRVCGPALESLMGWTADSVRPPTQPVRLTSLLPKATTPP
jgi:D-hydroxyproline dehydrogenase subunit alpha